VFEGIRCYKCKDGRSAILMLDAHIERLYDSAHIADLKIPFEKKELTQVCKEIVKVNPPGVS
ncbi:MAG TPA: aminotransferase class IV, partial [Syntrophorhabdales bacterium]|nr:aminotransferase class IV [Syntrophorhabdales bacterium]